MKSNLVIIWLLLMVTAPTMAQEAEEAPAPVFEVAEMAFGLGMDGETRELVGEAAVFAAGTPVIYCRTRIVGADAPTSVTHVWYRDGKTQARVDLTVGSSDWRTYSSKRLLPEWTGAWEVRVLDDAGNLLQSATFTVE